jgi:hypothetical protein
LVHASRVAIYTGSAIVLLAALLAVTLKTCASWPIFQGKPDGPDQDKTVKLFNSALLRVHSSLPFGASDVVWELLYREKSGWEKVDDWQVEGQISLYGGNVLACPVGKLVVVVREDGSLVFVRTEAGEWKTFHMEIPERAPFPLLGVRGTSLTALDTPKIQELRSQMSINAAVFQVPPQLGQFLPDKRELLVDYLAPADRRFRLRMSLSSDGEQLRFVDFQQRPFERDRDTTGPPFFRLLPDTPLSSECNNLEFFH